MESHLYVRKEDEDINIGLVYVAPSCHIVLETARSVVCVEIVILSAFSFHWCMPVCILADNSYFQP